MALTRASPEEAKERVKKVLAATSAPFAVNYILAFEPLSLSAALEAGAPYIQFSWGIPDQKTTSLISGAGAKFGVQVASAQGAIVALEAGAEYLVCQGVEAGGHVQATRPLLEVLEEVLPVASGKSVFAAGGIASGPGITRALTAGAAGVCLGTRFVATQESSAHPDYKQALLKADSKHAVLTVCFEGGWANALHRSLRNKTLSRWEAAGCPPSGKRPGEGDVLAKRPDGSPVLRYAAFSPSKSITGERITECALHAGMGVGEIRDIPAAGELVTRLWEDHLAAAKA
jgi:nitronate monooxygenase